MIPYSSCSIIRETNKAAGIPIATPTENFLIALLLAITLTGCSCHCQRFLPDGDGMALDSVTGQVCDARPDRLQGHIRPSCHYLYTAKIK